MSNYVFSVPGYAARPAKYGPEWFRLAGSDPSSPGNPLAWSDQQGVPDGTGITFRGIGGTDNWFHFPITIPSMVDGKSLTCDQVWLQLVLEKDFAFLRDLWLFDGSTPFLQGGTKNDPTGDLRTLKITDQNLFTLKTPHAIQGTIGISAHVVFTADALVTFAGASLFLTR